MPQSVHSSVPPRDTIGARDLQATLYREIGISAVAAALHSISKPEPAQRASDVATSALQTGGRTVRAA